MRVLLNKSPNHHLVIILHGQYGSLSQPLVRKIFDRLYNLKQKVVLFEFSYVALHKPFHPDQTTEAHELKNFLKNQRFTKLTIIAHSNAIFITLVLWQMGIKINNLILLGFPTMQNKQTPQEIANMLHRVLKKGHVLIIQAQGDEYTKISYIQKFLRTFHLLRIPTYEIEGNHHFEGFEEKAATLIHQKLLHFDSAVNEIENTFE